MVRLAATQPKGSKIAASETKKASARKLDNFSECRTQLTHSLQSSLELDTILQRFFSNTTDFLPVDSIRFISTHSAVDINVGREQQHQASYNLKTDESNLGKISFSRRHRFIETELLMLEMLIGVLFFPLRNALLYKEAIEASMKDPLTGIGNRAALENGLNRELKLAARHSHGLALLVIDVDHFKAINDELGHHSGDKALIQVVSTIQNTLRETDQIFRFGGEEFVAILNQTRATEATIIAERIRINIAMTPIKLDHHVSPLTISTGISVFSKTETADQLLREADKALYKAKHNGRNRVELWQGDEALRSQGNL